MVRGNRSPSLFLLLSFSPFLSSDSRGQPMNREQPGATRLLLNNCHIYRRRLTSRPQNATAVGPRNGDFVCEIADSRFTGVTRTKDPYMPVTSHFSGQLLRIPRRNDATAIEHRLHTRISRSMVSMVSRTILGLLQYYAILRNYLHRLGVR